MEYYIAKKNELNNRYKSQKYYIEWMKPNTKQYILYDSIYKSSRIDNKFMVIDISEL